jgi:hypothetical protein
MKWEENWPENVKAWGLERSSSIVRKYPAFSRNKRGTSAEIRTWQCTFQKKVKSITYLPDSLVYYTVYKFRPSWIKICYKKLNSQLVFKYEIILRILETPESELSKNGIPQPSFRDDSIITEAFSTRCNIYVGFTESMLIINKHFLSTFFCFSFVCVCF